MTDLEQRVADRYGIDPSQVRDQTGSNPGHDLPQTSLPQVKPIND